MQPGGVPGSAEDSRRGKQGAKAQAGEFLADLRRLLADFQPAFKPAFAISAAISPISNSLARNGQKVIVPVE
jgi:hypothetical protein